VIDGATNTTTTVGTGSFPIAVAVNPVRNKIYVANGTSNNVTVIDGATNTTTTVGTGTSPFAVAVNPVNNKIYVANYNSNNVTVIDGATNTTTTTLGVGTAPWAVVVNPVTNKIYVANSVSNNVTVIDGAANTTTTLGVGNGPFAFIMNPVAVNPVTNKIYVVNSGGNSVTALTEQQVQSIPLTTAIAPLPSNTFVNPGSPTFNFTTTNTYSPNTPLVQNVYYQLDTWQGPWLQASGFAPNFSGAAPQLLPGVHIVYAYATDSQFAGGNGVQNSPIPGAMAAYVFLVQPAPSSTALTLTGGTNPSTFGQPVSFTASVSGGAGTPTGVVAFLDGATLLGTQPLNRNGQASLTTTPLSLSGGSHPITAVYEGDILYSSSASSILNQVVNQAMSTTQLTGPTNSIYGQSVQLNVTVLPQLGGTPSGTLTFYDGGTSLGTAPLNASGSAVFLTTATALQAGSHTITAVYSGDTNFMGGTSDPVTPQVSQAGSGVAVALTMGSNPSQFGKALTFTATVNPQFAGVPTGQMTFKDGSSILGTKALNGSAKASLTTATFGIGTHSITAFYTGDPNFMASDSSSSPLSQTVNTNAGTALSSFVLTTTPATITANTPLFRKAITFTATIAPTAATGTVSFIDGTTLLGTATLSGGVASINTTQLGPGTHFIAVSYSGDSTYRTTAFIVTLYRSPRPH
jgi:YVTN family beta-propeller protein